MGLDMYLEKRTYVKNWSHMTAKELHTITVKRGGRIRTDIKPEHISHIIEEVAYWRKANAIHRWFVANVQDGHDDCKEYHVTEGDLRKLLSLCGQVLESSQLVDGDVTNCYTFKDGKEIPIIEKGKVIKDASKARGLLPTQSGFFFGCTDYDEDYLRDIQYTKDTLEKLLAEAPRSCDYYYCSSW